MQQLLAAERLGPFLDVEFFIFQTRQKTTEGDSQRQLR
jgi:hypothetical protein